jgi:hypothetical protein
MKKKLYISVAITGRNIEEAKDQAEHAKGMLCESYNVITPFDIHQDRNKPYSFYMGKDIEILLECDAIYLCPGWVHSKGCNAEYQIAKIYGLEIID